MPYDYDYQQPSAPPLDYVPAQVQVPAAKVFHPGRWFAGGAVVGALVVSLVGGACFYALEHLDPSQLAHIPVLGLLAPAPAIDDEAQERLSSAIEDARSLAEGLAALSDDVAEACKAPEADGYVQKVADIQDEQRSAVADGLTRVADARSVIEDMRALVSDDSEEAPFLSQAEDALASMAQLLAYERNLLEAQQELGALPEPSGVNGETAESFQPIWNASLRFETLKAPVSLADLHECYIELYGPLATYLYEERENGKASTLELHTMREVLDWGRTNEARAHRALQQGIAQQYRYTAWLLDAAVDEEAQPEVSWAAVSKIKPNLYPSTDAVLGLTVTSPRATSVSIEVEIDGLTQKLEQRRTIEPGANHILLKPQLLSGLSVANLENARTAQIDFKVMAEDGAVLEQQSVPVEVLSLFDFNWIDSEFGTSSQLDLLAWLRPSQAVIDDINRRATQYMGEWTDGMFAEIAGYQYGDDWYGTLLQVAAIQKAFSDTGTAYVADTYSSRADQRVLTPAVALERKQALCVETSLIVASCLTSAGMHPYLIITPGHSQVALETWEGSGQFFLVETSLLPYEGPNRELAIEDTNFYGGLVPFCEDANGTYSCLDMMGSSEFWDRFIASSEDGGDAFGGVYVIDCTLQRTFGLQGLDAM